MPHTTTRWQRVWHDEDGSNVAQAAAVALFAAALLGVLVTLVSPSLGQQVRHAFGCLAAALAGGAACPVDGGAAAGGAGEPSVLIPWLTTIGAIWHDIQNWPGWAQVSAGVAAGAAMATGMWRVWRPGSWFGSSPLFNFLPIPGGNSNWLSDWTAGLLKQMLYNGFWWIDPLSSGPVGNLQTQPGESPAMLKGREGANGASIALGLVEMWTGGQSIGGGLLLCAPSAGLGCVAAGVGAIAVVHGGLTAVMGAIQAGVVTQAQAGNNGNNANAGNGGNNPAPAPSGGSLPQQRGAAYEQYLKDKLGGPKESFTRQVGDASREFDGGIGGDTPETAHTWYEAKSGDFWSDPQRVAKFQSQAGTQQKIADQLGKKFVVYSENEIPQNVKDWLTKRGIPYYENFNDGFQYPTP